MALAWTELADDELERQYSPSSCLPDGDYQPFIDIYKERSRAVWAEIDERPDAQTQVVPYGPGASNTMHVATAKRSSPSAMLVFIHGGYWQELSSSDSLFAATACLDHGWAFAAVDYPLAPHASLDEIVASCCAALTKLRDDAPHLGVDANRIFVAGSSAGAHLAAMVALKSGIALAGTILVSGVFDLEPLVGTTINDAVGMDLAEAARNSPLRHAVEGFPATVVACGSIETDQFKVQSQAFAAHIEATGTQVTRVEVLDRNHFDVILDLAEPETLLGDAVASLIDS